MLDRDGSDGHGACGQSRQVVNRTHANVEQCRFSLWSQPPWLRMTVSRHTLCFKGYGVPL